MESDVIFKNLTKLQSMTFALAASSIIYLVNPAFAMESQDVEFKSTGLATKFIQHPDKLEITTDNNNWASYQAESKRYPVTSGQLVKVDYSIDVTKGIMSLGTLNTNRNGWYSNQKGDVEEIIRGKGLHEGTIEWLVPINETETSLVLRNYHLAEPGESVFTVSKMKMEIKDRYEIYSPAIISQAKLFSSQSQPGKWVLQVYRGAREGICYFDSTREKSNYLTREQAQFAHSIFSRSPYPNPTSNKIAEEGFEWTYNMEPPEGNPFTLTLTDYKSNRTGYETIPGDTLKFRKKL